jgi:hypothetical protein
MSYSALHEPVHVGEILRTSSPLSFVWQVLAVAQGSMSVVTDKRGHFRQGQFVFVPKYTAATQIPNGKSQLAVVDAGHHFISRPWYMHVDLPCRVASQRPKIDFDRKLISEIN